MFSRFGRFREFGRGARRAAVLATVVATVMTAIALPAAAKTRRPTRIWDPGIQDIAEVVEELRGLEFTQPVPIEFVGDDRRTYKRHGFGPGDRDYYQAEGRHLQALGLIAPGTDLSPMWSRDSAMGVLGYYDDGGPVIVIFQDSLTPLARVVVAHELTHALDDQHYDFVRHDDFDSEPEVLAYRATIEGDAQRVEQAYVARLSPQDRRDVHRGFRAVGRRFRTRSGIGDELEWFGAVSGVPYLIGREYTRSVLTQHGPRALARLFSPTPRDDTGVLDPVAPGPAWSYLGTRGIANGERDGEPQYPGAVEVYLILASRVPADVAYAAARGADGSSLVFYRRGTTTCARLSLVSSRFGVTDVEAAASAWAAASQSHATTSSDGAVVSIDSCGGLPSLESGAITVPATMLAGRTRAVAAALDDGATDASAECVGTELLHDAQYRDGVDGRWGDVVNVSEAPTSEYRVAVRRASVKCGVVRDVRGSRPR